jgi:CrcB protein
LNEKLKIALVVGTGGFIGSIGRYLISSTTTQSIFSAVSTGTILVNLTGCFIIGLLYGIGEWVVIPVHLRFFLAAGLCGGFTTFSAFSIETFSMIKDGLIFQASLYILSSVILGIAATFLGVISIRLFQF